MDIVMVPVLQVLLRDASIVRARTAAVLDDELQDFADFAPELVAEMTFARMVDSFQAYLIEILTEVARRHPQVLGLAEKNGGAAAEAHIDRLSRGGTGRLMGALLETFGEAVCPSAATREAMDLYVDVRNLLVHHRGRIHERFAGRWGLDADRVGALYELPDEFVKQASRDLLQVGSNIDEIAITRFGVPPAVDDTD